MIEAILVLARGQIIADRYRLERLLGTGGMGIVWVARHLELDSLVALKFQLASAGQRAKHRFRAEARAAAQLKSPYVAHVYDYGFDGELPFIAMELLSGESLSARLAREQRLPLDAAFRIAGGAARALEFAHGLGLVHRDVKPSNLFLAEEPAFDVVKLLDFGIARWCAADAGDELDSSRMLGSVPYLSPEQARGQRVDHRSDVWALAVVAYETMSGRTPFEAESPLEMVHRIDAGRLTALSARLGAAYTELDALFARAFRRELELRFQSAREFAGALAHALRRMDPEALGREPPSVKLAARPGREGQTAPLDALVLAANGSRSRQAEWH